MSWEKIKSEVEETLDDRMFLYRLLARLYRIEADEQLLDELKSFVFPSTTAHASMNQGAQLLNDYLSKEHADIRQELAVDFTRLFILRERYSKDVPYPFESVYTSQVPTMMGDARDRVFDIYRSAGLQVNTEFHLSEDHIALELEFMSFLARRTKEAFEAGEDSLAVDLLEQQQSFLQGHILNWIGYFTDAVKETSRTDFYKGLADFTRGFLETDAVFLDQIKDSFAVRV